jgi:hypothetical protein
MRRLPAAALAGSLLGHGVLLLWLGSLYAPGARHDSLAEVTPAEISYVHLPRLEDGPTITLVTGASRDPGVTPPEADDPPSPPRGSPPDSASGPPRETSAANIVAGSPAPASAASLLRGGFSDARLHGVVSALRPKASGSLQERFDASLSAAMGVAADSLAEQRRRALADRQVRVLGRGITIFGDSANSHWRRFKIGNERVILPIDGREWDDLQMKKQRDGFVRDSILRARAAATRARVDADRRKDQR